MKKLLLGSALTALATSTAFAQSTGSVDFESTIVVTAASADKGLSGVVAPDTSKAKAVLTQQFIANQSPGQSINEIINQLPGVSFQNNDPYGSSGGKMFIRGFDKTRISQTFDGIPLNDSGSYDLFSNQQLDPELIEQVNVNLGSTDVDSPTAAATGSTVNYRSKRPDEEFGAMLSGSVGKFDYTRIFGKIETGELNATGTRAWFAASASSYDAPYGGIGKLDKQQYNAKIYQPIGGSSDFVSVAAHYNQNRNNFFGSLPLRRDTTQSPLNPAVRIAGPDAGNRQPLTKDERFYVIPACTVAGASPGVASTPNTCGSQFDFRTNPSNTGNIRINSKFTLSDKLTLFVDPSYQYVKANGGGPVNAVEAPRDVNPTGTPAAANCATTANSATVNCQTGYIGGVPFFGRDLNGDGDILDQVRVQAPSQTKTNRFGLITSLRYDISDDHSVRLAYSLDYARHRQTGEVGFLGQGGQQRPFPVDNPEKDFAGNILQKRDRFSKAILHQISGEYRGEFMDDKLVANVGIRAPFFKRDLNQFCFTTSAGGFVDCFARNTTGATAYATLNPAAVVPQRRVFKYDKILPNMGLTFDIDRRTSVFANYSKGLQVPGTDNLYQSFFFARGLPDANPSPETTDNFDLGVRYRAGKVQAQLTGWYTIFQNRLASAFDRDLSVTVYRNLGKVTKYGIDGSVSYQPIPEISLYGYGSYLKSKIKDNIDAGSLCTAANVAFNQLGCSTVGQVAFFQTKGKRESGAPIYTLGGRVEGRLGPVQVGIQAKRTGSRYINDQNIPVFQTYASTAAFRGPVPGLAVGSVIPFQVYGAKSQGYTLVDIDVRVSMEWAGLNDRTYFKFNATNLFDKLFVGGFDGGTTSATSVPFAQVGAPRTYVGTFVIGF